MIMPMAAEMERAAGPAIPWRPISPSLIDTVGVRFCCRDGRGGIVPTIISVSDYLRPRDSGSPNREGGYQKGPDGTIAVIDVDISDESGNLIVVGRGCYGTPKS